MSYSEDNKLQGDLRLGQHYTFIQMSVSRFYPDKMRIKTTNGMKINLGKVDRYFRNGLPKKQKIPDNFLKFLNRYSSIATSK